jgi:Leucine-rich repeat (LRR) protein
MLDLRQLSGMTHLRELNLSDTHVSDAGLEHLKGLTGLENLNIRDTQVTENGMRMIREILVDCSI